VNNSFGTVAGFTVQILWKRAIVGHHLPDGIPRLAPSHPLEKPESWCSVMARTPPRPAGIMPIFTFTTQAVEHYTGSANDCVSSCRASNRSAYCKAMAFTRPDFDGHLLRRSINQPAATLAAGSAPPVRVISPRIRLAATRKVPWALRSTAPGRAVKQARSIEMKIGRFR
jgi:hypothetical protein